MREKMDMIAKLQAGNNGGYKVVSDELQQGREYLALAIPKLVAGGMRLKRIANSEEGDPTPTDLTRIDALMSTIRATVACENELAWIFGPMRKESQK